MPCQQAQRCTAQYLHAYVPDPPYAVPAPGFMPMACLHSSPLMTPPHAIDAFTEGKGPCNDTSAGLGRQLPAPARPQLCNQGDGGMHLHALSHASRCACIPTPWEAAQTFGTGPGGPGAAHACHLHSSAWLAGRPFNADAHVSPSAARPAWDRVGNGSRCGELQAGGGGGGELSTSWPLASHAPGSTSNTQTAQKEHAVLGKSRQTVWSMSL